MTTARERPELKVDGTNTAAALPQDLFFGAFDNTQRDRKLMHAVHLHSADANVPFDIGNRNETTDHGERQ